MRELYAHAKNEEIDCRLYSTMEELEQNIENFIEGFYDRERLYSALHYRSPEEFEKDAAQQTLLDAIGVELSKASGNLSRYI